MHDAYSNESYAPRIHRRTRAYIAPRMDDAERRENMLGAYVLAVADRLRGETEAAVGHTRAAAAGRRRSCRSSETYRVVAQPARGSGSGVRTDSISARCGSSRGGRITF